MSSTVTRRAELDVSLIDFKAALAAVYPHRNKVKTGDDQAEHRIRWVFSAGQLFVMASNGSTSALAKVRILEDTRGALGELGPDDGPMVVDMQPRRIPLIQQQFKPNKSENAAMQLVHFDVCLDPADPFVDLTDVGGLWSEGESARYPIEEPAEAFPDVIAITGAALARAGESSTGKDLVTDPALLALFAAAGKAYDSQVQIRATGTPESRGFVVMVGSDFIGTIESRHSDDDGLKRRDKATMDWLKLLKPNKLVAV